MLRLETILAPVDFSQQTDAEAKNAAEIAKRFKSRLILAHVIPRFADGVHLADPEAIEAYSHEFSSDIEQGIQKALQSLARRAAAGADVECVVVSGDPAEEVKKLAGSRQVDLVVMPASVPSRMRRQLLGSITKTVLEDLNCPVLTGVHLQEAAARNGTPYKKVACEIVLGESGIEQLRWARDFAEAYGSSLHVVCVLPFIDSLGAAPSLPEHLRGGAIADAEEKLRAISKREDAEAEVTALGGAVEEVLPDFLSTRNIDLFVSDRRRKQDRMGLFGLHTDVIDTVKTLPCPAVLV